MFLVLRYIMLCLKYYFYEEFCFFCFKGFCFYIIIVVVNDVGKGKEKNIIVYINE